MGWKENNFHSEGNQAAEQVAQRGRAVFTLGRFQGWDGWSTDQPGMVSRLTLSWAEGSD